MPLNEFMIPPSLIHGHTQFGQEGEVVETLITTFIVMLEIVALTIYIAIIAPRIPPSSYKVNLRYGFSVAVTLTPFDIASNSERLLARVNVIPLMTQSIVALLTMLHLKNVSQIHAYFCF
ncbi:hypothetical protein CR513_41329, partial [Mucuna pruriens]